MLIKRQVLDEAKKLNIEVFFARTEARNGEKGFEVELIGPDGFRFEGTDTHDVVECASTEKDAGAAALSTLKLGLVECPSDCECH